MAIDNDQYISLELALEWLGLSLEQVRYHTIRGHLTAYVELPAFLPAPGQYTQGSDSLEYVTPVLGMFWEEQLAKYSKIEPNFRWTDGYIEFDTIKVVTVSGLEPTPSEGRPVLPKSYGHIAPGGELCWRVGWKFRVKDIVFDENEVLLFRDQHSIGNAVGKNNPASHTASADNSVEQPPQETDKELCQRLQTEGLPEKEIAKRLRQQFREISTYRIGELLPANGNANIAASSITKRGWRLLQ